MGKISSACLGFRFNWPRMSFPLPDFQSMQDLIIKQPPCSTCPGGSVFLQWSGGRETKLGAPPRFYNCSGDNILEKTQTTPELSVHPQHHMKQDPPWTSLTSDHRDHREVWYCLIVPYAKGHFQKDRHKIFITRFSEKLPTYQYQNKNQIIKLTAGSHPPLPFGSEKAVP